MELIYLLKKSNYFAESFELESIEKLLEKLKEISYIEGKFDEYAVQKIVKNNEVNEKLEFSIHVKENDKIFSVEEYLKNNKR
jgi:hypothetical protein